MLPPRVQPRSSRQKLTIWLRIVASAAPLTPISSTKMNNGSIAILSTAPTPMPIMPKNALPWNLSWLFSTRDEAINGVPIRIYMAYCRA